MSVGWAKTFFLRSGRHCNMLSPSHCNALWCKNSFRSRCWKEIMGSKIWVPLPALLRRFWASHSSLAASRVDSLNLEHFCSEAMKNVPTCSLVWTNLPCSIMRGSRACYGVVARQCGQYAASYRSGAVLGRGRPACPPLVTTWLSAEGKGWRASPGCGEPVPHSPCGFERSGPVLSVSVPLHGDSNLGVEWRPNALISARLCCQRWGVEGRR